MVKAGTLAEGAHLFMRSNDEVSRVERFFGDNVDPA